MSVPPIDPIQPPAGPQAGPGFYQPLSAPRKQLNIFALIGFITTVTFTGFIIGSLVLSIIGLVQITKEPERYQGKWLAIAGVVINGGIVLSAIVLLFLLIRATT